MQESCHNANPNQNMFSIDALLSSSRRPEFEASFHQFLPRWQTPTTFGYAPSLASDLQPFGGMLICIMILVRICLFCLRLSIDLKLQAEFL